MPSLDEILASASESVRQRNAALRGGGAGGRESSHSEADLQQAVVAWAWAQDAPYDLLRCVPNDGPGVYSFGVVSGTPDLLLPVPSGEYGALWIELKAGTNDLTGAQYQQMRRLCAAGHAVEVAWTFEQAQYVMRCYVQTPDELLPGW